MNVKSVLKKAKSYYDEYKEDIEIYLALTVFGCICSAFGYHVANAKFDKFKLGLTFACLADRSLVDHLKEATEKSIDIAKKL